MKKEGFGGLFNSQDGKVNLFLLVFMVLVFIFTLWNVEALTITINTPTNLTYNGSRNVNFTFTPVWHNDAEAYTNCTLFTNQSGWAVARNFGNWSTGDTATDTQVLNNTLSWVNFTFNGDGNFTYNIGCFLNNASNVLNFSGDVNGTGNTTFFIDSLPPTIRLDRPFPTNLGGLVNITSNATSAFYVNISDNSTHSVWFILNTQATFFGFFGHYGVTADTNETQNRSMTLDTAIATSSPHVRRYNTSIFNLINFSSNFTGPGPHGVFFCVNDTLGRRTCSEKVDFIIKGMLGSDLERDFGRGDMKHADHGFTFRGLDIRYGNGSDFPSGEFLNPTDINLTFNINFTDSQGVFIVGARINESALSSSSRSNYSSEVSTQARNEIGAARDNSNMTWVDIGKFIPSEVSYEFGIVQMRGTFGKVFFCNGTSTQSPNCFRINQCNATNLNIFNHTSIIPTNSACWLTSGSWGVNPTESALTTNPAFTYIFVDHFSGGLGSNDFGPPNATFISPADTTNLNNRSTTVEQLINFTIDDTDSTGLNLTANNSINLTITLGGSVVGFFNFTNDTGSRLSCYRTVNATQSPQNVTHIWCNATYSFNSNGTYLLNVTGRDTSNNSNAMNTTTNYISITVDQIPPVFVYYNFTNASNFNTSTLSGGPNQSTVIQLGTTAGTSRAQGDPVTGIIFAVANWTDNLTQPLQGRLQFFNETGGAGWQTLNNSNATYRAIEHQGWTNFSFPIPSGRNEFEGRNVSFRIIVNDTLGNVNDSRSVKNFTIQINDTTAPEIRINGTLGVNGTNTTNTAPLVGWNILEGKRFNKINVSVDATDQSTENSDLCTKFKQFAGALPGTASDPNTHRNDSLQISSTGTCPLSNGAHNVSITAIDSAGNLQNIFHTFSVQNQTLPALFFVNLTTETGLFNKSAINNTNITSAVGLAFGGAASGGLSGSNIANLTYVSSCNSTSTVVFSNNTVIYPFNESTCPTQSENRTLTVKVTDTAGNSNTTTFVLLVDNVGPTITIQSPTAGQRFTDIKTTLNFSVIDDDQPISFAGYYLDGSSQLPENHTINRSIGSAGFNITSFTLVNHTGTHTIKFTFNDSLGNAVNSSEITFAQVGPIDFLGANKTIADNNVNNVSNVSFFDASGNLLSAAANINQTIKLFMALNGSGAKVVNVTVNFNGSAANWNLTTEIFVRVNDSTVVNHLRNNQSAIILDYIIFVNNSFAKFLPDNESYFGVLRLPMNANSNGIGGQSELWYFANENDMSSKVNITQCAGGFSPTHQQALSAGTFPCWNNTDNQSVDVFVPHFSVVAFTNNTNAPTANVTTPASIQTEGMFIPNITTSSDAVTCLYQVNGSTSNTSMSKSGNICLGVTERLKNWTGTDNTRPNLYNITFSVIDDDNNINTYVWAFNVTDSTLPNAPNGSRVSSSVGETSATVTITNINESVNANVSYGTSVGSLGSTSLETDFNQTQAVSITGLTASTQYHFNVTVCDFNNQCVKNGTFNFTTSSAATTTTTTTTTTTSAGGGGGGAVTSNVEASAGRQWDSLAAGSSGVLTINKENIAVTGVIIDVKNAVTNPSITVEKLVSNPLSTAAAAKVYQYLQLKKSNIADLDASKITINFKVPKSWLTSNSVGEDDVVLYRYSDGKWNALPTSKTGADANNVIYQSTTPGFSTFAIGSTEAAPAPLAPTEAPAVPTEAVPVPAPAAPAEAPAAPAMEEKKGLSNTAIAWIVVVIIVIVAGIGYYMWQKKKAEL